MIRWYFDEDSANEALAIALRANGCDILLSREADMDGAADPDQLMFAVRAGRVLLTANIRDFSLLHRARLEAGEHHPGIVLRHQRRRDTGDQIRRLRALIASLDQDDMVDRVEFLARWA